MKNFTWFKHPKDLSNDKRVSVLIDREGGKGYGTYIYIIEVLHMQPDGKLTFQQLNTMKRKGFGKSYMERIVRNYQLFHIKGNEFESAICYGYSPKDLDENVPNPSEDSRIIDEVSSNIEETPFQNEKAKNSDNTQSINEKERKLCLARVREEKIREEKNRKEQNRENRNDADDGRKYGSWRTLVDSLEPDSEWKEMACMKSGFGMLLMKHFKEALEIFKGHIILHGREQTICSQEDARNYFANYSRQGQYTSIELHKALLALDAARQTDNPYRYEQIVNGQRTYLGCPIPSDAPPRPNASAFWNEETQSWISQ